jgi:hypothetical protein
MRNYPSRCRLLPCQVYLWQGGGQGELEEPRGLSQTYGGRFSPSSTSVRNSSPLGTPVGNTNVGVSAFRMTGNIVVGIPESNAREKLLALYTEKTSAHVLSKVDKTNIAEVAKQQVVGRMKFILPDRKFPSFWQPDLLANTPGYVDAFFNSYGYGYSTRKNDAVVLEQAAELWKAAAPKIKKIVDNHRSSVAQKMKTDILKGMCSVVVIYCIVEL